MLEIGPGYGAATRILLERVPRLTGLEADSTSAQQLRTQLNKRVTIVHGDGTAMPFPDQPFSAVVCFTMLHHVPAIELQDALFTEALRVLRPGGMFAGYDSQLNLGFLFLRIGDTMIVLDPTTLRARLQAAGLTDIDVTHMPRRRADFSGYKPAPGE